MIRFFLFLLVFPLSLSFAQVLEKTIPFSAATVSVEPDGRKDLVKISATDFVLLSKVRGGPHTEAAYMLERYDMSLNQKYSVEIINLPEDDFLQLHYNGSDLILFFVHHNILSKKTKLKASIFDVNTGAKKTDKLLHEFAIGEWVASTSKGAVKQTFENAICSGLAHGYVTPLQYQYKVVYSPDGSKTLAYIYDHSQKNLIAQTILMDKNLNILQQGIVPIDNGFVNYGLYPNNRGEVFILNGDRGGRIALIRYNLETKDARFLDIQASSARRESLKLSFLSDDMVYVGNINTSGGQLSGVMYSRFNFADNIIDKINFYDLSEGLIQTMNVSRSANKNLSGNENWKNFELTDFIVNEYEKILMVVEKRELQDPMIAYDPMAVDDIKNWIEKMSKVNIESVVMFSFNSQDELLWENCYAKWQNNELLGGMIVSSYSLDITADGKVRMLYAGADNPTIGYNKINMVEWDELTGSRLRDISLSNPQALTLIRPYTVWNNNTVIVAGRKGVFGKKSFIDLYKLSAN